MDTAEVEDLYRFARERSAEGRAALTTAVANLFQDRGDRLTDRERTLIFSIFRSVVHDVEMGLRRRVSGLLANAKDVPRELVCLLANDEIEVALPVILRSPVLEDADLVDLVWYRALEHQLAVATRTGISADVSQALVETGDSGVVRALLDNTSAVIADTTMEYLVE